MLSRTRPLPPIAAWAVLLPALFAAPTCALWFSSTGAAPDRLEARAQHALTEAAEKEARRFKPRTLTYRGVRTILTPAPEAPVAPDLAALGGLQAFCAGDAPEKATISRFCSALSQSGWAAQAARLGLLGGALIVLLLLAARWGARGPPFFQRIALGPGWSALRSLGAAQFVLSTALALWTLYWAQVVLFGSEPGIWSAVFAGICGLLLLTYLVHLRGRSHRSVPTRFEYARIFNQDEAPELYANLEALAARVGAAPPDRVVLGIEPDVALIDGAVECGGARESGRTLYVGFEPLRRLEREELDALVLHELAHHAPGAGAHAAGLGRMERRLRWALSGFEPAAFLAPSFALMRLYAEGVLAGTAARRVVAERGADALAAAESSPQVLARALIRISTLQAFYERTEDAILEAELKTGKLPPLLKALEQGWPDYTRSRQLERDLKDAAVHHPWDVHAPLPERLEALGETALLERLARGLFELPRRAWLQTVLRGELYERELWRSQEANEAWLDDEEPADHAQAS